jgi:Uma2 family endonuclease
MTIATDRPIQKQILSFDEFFTRYGDDNRYELIDEEVFDLEPTGPHEEVAAFITTKVCVQIEITGLPWFVLQRGLLRPSNIGMTAFRPDVVVVNRDELTKELFWADQSILTLDSSIKFVAEVVSNNWQNDYARKLEDYAVLGIPEYWIADYAGLGGTRHIGKPKQPTLSICTLVNGEYEVQQLRGHQTIVSLTFPNLKLTAEQVLRSGRSAW